MSMITFGSLPVPNKQPTIPNRLSSPHRPLHFGIITAQESADISANKRHWTTPVQTILTSLDRNKVSSIQKNKVLQKLFSFSLTSEHAEHMANLYNTRQEELGCPTFKITGAAKAAPVIEDPRSNPSEETKEALPNPFQSGGISPNSHAQAIRTTHRTRTHRTTREEKETAYQQGDRSKSLVKGRSPKDFWTAVDAWHDTPVRDAKARKEAEPIKLPSGDTISVESARNWFDRLVDPEGFKLRTQHKTDAKSP
jgi:hypothetical protein